MIPGRSAVHRIYTGNPLARSRFSSTSPSFYTFSRSWGSDCTFAPTFSPRRPVPALRTPDGWPAGQRAACFRSEEVLQHLWLAHARRVVRVTGEGGRDWLVRRLRERGVDAADLPVYVRVPCAARVATLRRIDAMVQPQLVVSSREALLALPALLGEARWLRLAAQTLFVSSDRLAALARGMQCRDVVVAASARMLDLSAAIAGMR